MHQKRVTSELHDSYFRLMTIKHTIPKIEWAIELLYNSVETGSLRQDVVEKATTRQKGPLGPPGSLRSDELETSYYPAEGALGTQWVLETRPVGEMLEWEHVPERLGPQAPSWATQENENDTRRCPEGLGRSICCSLCSVFNSLSHTQPFQIKWEVYFLKKSSLVFIVSLWFCMHMHIYHVSIQQDPIKCYGSRPQWIWERWQWRSIPHSLKLQHYWNLTIRLFSVISWTLVWGWWVLPLCRDLVGVFYSLSRLSN